jgi:hypothetical protein
LCRNKDHPVRSFAVLALLGFPLLGGCNNAPPAEPKAFAPPVKQEKRVALQAKSLHGVLHGKVVYDGDAPALEFIERIKDNEDRDACLKGPPAETHKQLWMVNRATNAVANVVVWLEPPTGKYFALREKDKTRKGEMVIMDQPHCAFVPHVVSVFPSYFDGAEQVKTGQKLRIRNSAPFLHTVQWNPTRENDMVSHPIPPNGGTLDVVFNPQKVCLAIGCGIHNWMHGIVWIFDHPYHAVTRDDGTFQIANLPTDVELTFNAWHESHLKPFEQRPITLKAGANPPVELTIKK